MQRIMYREDGVCLCECMVWVCVIMCAWVDILNVFVSFLYLHSHTALAPVITSQLVCVDACVCSNGFNTPIMHHSAYMHAWTKWVKRDLLTSLCIYMLIRETDTCFRSLTVHFCLPGHESDFSAVFSLWLKIGKGGKKENMFSLSFFLLRLNP